MKNVQFRLSSRKAIFLTTGIHRVFRGLKFEHDDEIERKGAFYNGLYELWGKSMTTISSKVTTKGQVVIPKKLREKYGIHSSTAIRWIEKDQGILMVPESEDPIAVARGMLKGSGILKAYLKEKQIEKQKEDKKVAKSQ